MLRKYLPFLIAGAATLALAGVMLLRQVTIFDQGEALKTRPAAWTVGQALRAAGVQLAPEDVVEPPAGRPLPFNGQVHIRRAAQVYLWEDGQARRITGLNPSPAALLAGAGIALQPGDRLLRNGQVIDPSEALPAGKAVVLQLERAKAVMIDDNGHQREIQTLRQTAAGALWEAGIRPGPGDRTSVEPNLLLKQGQPIAYQQAQPLVINIGGQQVGGRSTAETVGQALADAGIALQGLDYSQPDEDQPLPEDGQIRVVRVREEIAVREELIPYGNTFTQDPEVELDTQKITVPGQYGVKVTRERARFEDGQEVQRAIDSDWVASQPVDQVLGYGTKVVVKTMDVPEGTIEYYRAVSVYATSYSPCRSGYADGRCSWSTSSGERLRKGIIAVTLTWYRMFRGSQVYVPGYGYGIIADVGGGIPGRYWIDLGFDETDYQRMGGWMTMYFLTPVPANVPWILP